MLTRELSHYKLWLPGFGMEFDVTETVMAKLWQIRHTRLTAPFRS